MSRTSQRLFVPTAAAAGSGEEELPPPLSMAEDAENYDAYRAHQQQLMDGLSYGSAGPPSSATMPPHSAARSDASSEVPPWLLHSAVTTPQEYGSDEEMDFAFHPPVGAEDDDEEEDAMPEEETANQYTYIIFLHGLICVKMRIDGFHWQHNKLIHRQRRKTITVMPVR